jgi:hypothetical protein
MRREQGTSGVSKYRPLQDYLRGQRCLRIELTFVEIELIIGNELPPSAYSPRWWTTAKGSRRHALWQNAWCDAGYAAMLLRGTDRVEFRRL